MNKIYTGVVTLVAVMAVVAGSAYALLTDTATISGVSFSTGTADLRIGNGSPGGTDNLDLSALPSFKVSPGASGDIVTAADPLNLYNYSTDDFNLSVHAQITSWSSSAGNWSALANGVYVRVHSVADSSMSSWVTLQQAYDTGIDLPGPSIPFGAYPNNKQGYTIEYSVDSALGNEVAGANLENIVITLTGTQVAAP